MAMAGIFPELICAETPQKAHSNEENILSLLVTASGRDEQSDASLSRPTPKQAAASPPERIVASRLALGVSKSLSNDLSLPGFAAQTSVLHRICRTTYGSTGGCPALAGD